MYSISFALHIRVKPRISPICDNSITEKLSLFNLFVKFCGDVSNLWDSSACVIPTAFNLSLIISEEVKQNTLSKSDKYYFPLYTL